MSSNSPLRPQKLTPQSLVGLADLLAQPAPSVDVAITGITHAAQAVLPGDLFIGLPGTRAHGASFARQAAAAGAVALLTDPAGQQFLGSDLAIPVLVTPDPRALMGAVASWVYGDPTADLTVLGITGTNGKTTTSYLLDAGLRGAGITSGLISTVQTKVADRVFSSVRTTPEATDLQGIFATMRENQVRTVAMEVSSHALELGRVSGVRFAVGAFTNLSQDHLDFHEDLESYFAAKAKLFDGRCAQQVVMIDDQWGQRLVSPNVITASAGPNQAAQFRALDHAVETGGQQRFRLVGPRGIDQWCQLQLPGAFNVANAVLAIAVLDAIGIDPAISAPAMADTVVPGRMERISLGQPFVALVDFAHTAEAVAGLLEVLRPTTAGRVIVVVGCGGDRDREKRPLMGRAAAVGADIAIITDDNPRSEDPAAIRASALAGALAVPRSARGDVQEIGDRREAIEAAVRMAKPGDTVVIAGKGHEQGQEISGVMHRFDDRQALAAAIEDSGLVSA